MKAFLVLVALALCAAMAAATDATIPPNSCSGFTTCQSCVAQQLCGWCSLPVVYPGNITGPQCAGFSPHKPQPFACNGIYSTETCVSGYTCNQSNYICQKGAPGTGIPPQQCEASCYNNGQVYLCNQTNKTCYSVPPGTPGAQSYSLCEANCGVHPSPTPSSPSPPTPVSLYACNYTTGSCYTAPAGQGTSLQVCQQQCQKTNGSEYLCNTFLQMCYKLPPGTPGGYSYQQCEELCTPHPTPGPPPAYILGVYRGIAINSGYVTGEYDMNITKTTFTLDFTTGNGQITTVTGVPFYINTSSLNEMWVNLTSGPNKGQFWKSIASFDGEPGPETSYATIAFSAVGQQAPASIDAAMTAAGANVFAFSTCLASAPECVFVMPALRNRRRVHDYKAQSKSTAHRDLKAQRIRRAEKVVVTDHCSQFAENCSYCLQHEYCGWCSVDVVYNGGQQGTQCAGFNPSNGSQAFVCNGRYSTLNCSAGYECDETNYQCVPTAPGNGMPQNECEEICHPTPPPPPPQPLYLCNTTTKQCLLCNTSNTTHYCPGGLPLAPCEAGCINPKPGPTGNIVGIWRGIHIQNNYPFGEIEMVFTNVSVTVYNNDVLNYTASIISIGADVMLFTITSGPLSGHKFGNIYQLSNVDSDMYTQMTFGEGILNAAIPPDYAVAMSTPGMRVLVLTKCNQSPCTFRNP